MLRLCPMRPGCQKWAAQWSLICSEEALPNEAWIGLNGVSMLWSLGCCWCGVLASSIQKSRLVREIPWAYSHLRYIRFLTLKQFVCILIRNQNHLAKFRFIDIYFDGLSSISPTNNAIKIFPASAAFFAWLLINSCTVHVLYRHTSNPFWLWQKGMLSISTCRIYNNLVPCPFLFPFLH